LEFQIQIQKRYKSLIDEKNTITRSLYWTWEENAAWNFWPITKAITKNVSHRNWWIYKHDEKDTGQTHEQVVNLEQSVLNRKIAECKRKTRNIIKILLINFAHKVSLFLNIISDYLILPKISYSLVSTLFPGQYTKSAWNNNIQSNYKCSYKLFLARQNMLLKS